MKKLLVLILGLCATHAMQQNQKPSADVMALLNQHQQELNALIRLARQDQNQQIKNAANQVVHIQNQLNQMQHSAAGTASQGDQPPAAVKKLVEQHQQAIQNLIKQAQGAGSAQVKQAAQKLEATQNNIRNKMENSSQSNANIRQRKLATRIQ